MTFYWFKAVQQLGIIATTLMIVWIGYKTGTPFVVILTAISPLLVTLAVQQPPADGVKSFFPPKVRGAPKVTVATLPPPPFNLNPPDSARSEDTKP